MSEKEKEPTLEELIEQLKDEDWRTRKQAVLSLGEIGDTASIRKLIELLKTEEDRVVKKTILHLLIE